MKSGIKKPIWKKVVIISSIVVLVAAPALYAWASVQAWNTANATTAQASSDLTDSVATQLATETAPESAQAALNDIIADYNNTLKEGPCELPSLYEWQSNLPWLKDTRQKCLDTTEASEELATSLKNLQTFLKEEAAAATLVEQTIASTANEKDYATASKTWLTLADDPSLKTDDAFKPVGAKITEVATGIATAYTALDTANKSQNKGSFDTAKKGLADAYARLPEIKTTSSEALAGLVDSVVKAYENS
ncbi:MAG: hypothetical protein WAQ27_05800 [Candidatus Microsaccharimonas sp.]